MHSQRDVIIKYAQNELNESERNRKMEIPLEKKQLSYRMQYVIVLLLCTKCCNISEKKEWRKKNRQRNENGPSLKMHMEHWFFFAPKLYVLAFLSSSLSRFVSLLLFLWSLFFLSLTNSKFNTWQFNTLRFKSFPFFHTQLVGPILVPLQFPFVSVSFALSLHWILLSTFLTM